MKKFIILSALLALAPAGIAAAQAKPAEKHETKVAASAVPQVVRNAVKKEWPNASVSAWSREVEKGRTKYEAETSDGGVKRDVLLGADGSILEVETTLTVAQLPAAVRKAATAGGHQIDGAEMVVAGQEMFYELKIRGRASELKLLPNGQPVQPRP